jgi:hypothetical protein
LLSTEAKKRALLPVGLKEYLMVIYEQSYTAHFFAGDILNRVIPVLIALALVIFFWGLISTSARTRQARIL